MYIGWCMLCGLHQIGVERIAHQHGDGASYPKILDLEELAIGSNAQHDVFDATLQILLAGGQTEDCHQFRGRGNVEACLRDNTVATKPRHHIAQSTIVHIEHTLPEDLTERETFFAMLVDVVVEHGADRIMGRCDSMKVTCEVEVDLLHRQHLGIATACRTSLHAEAWT